jgi:ABC-type lipoprotein export system ATPase subunit
MVVTHDLTVAAMADRVVELQDGVVVDGGVIAAQIRRRGE